MESIYNLIPREEVRAERKPRYVSQHASKAREEYKETKGDGALMGPASSSTKSPSNFLKKKTGGAGATVRKPVTKRDHKVTKPPVPRKDEKPVMGLKTDRNYIRDNAVEAITKAPPQTRTKVQLVPGGKGGVVDAEASGLVPKYTKRKDYGKVPSYLSKRQQEETQAQQDYEQYLQQVQAEGAHYQVSEEERRELLQGLRANMADLQRDYLGLSVVADTASKRTRKKQMEEQLAQLEADIAKVERHAVILVSK